MGKYTLRCPECAKNNKEIYVEVRGGLFNSGFFGNKKTKCANGHTIWVKSAKMTSKTCPHCGNTVVYDQSKGESATCPVCHSKLNTLNDNIKRVTIECPQCTCEHTVSLDASSMICPLCNTTIDIQREIEKTNIQKKNVVSLIKYEGDNNTFVWKHPIEDFKLGSQLIVHESQEAVLFCGGEALDVFSRADTYTLTTEKIPMLSSIYKLPSGDGTFHSEIYFINKTEQTGIKWGTREKFGVRDPETKHYFHLGANGTLSLEVSNSKKLLVKLIGTTNLFGHSNNISGDEYDGRNQGLMDSSASILNHIKTVILTKMRPIFIKAIEERNEPIFKIDSYADELANLIREKINEDLDDYGLYMPKFFINHVQTPDETDEYPDEKKRYAEAKAAQSVYTEVKTEKNLTEIERAKGEKEVLRAEIERQKSIIAASAKAEATKIKADAITEIRKERGLAENAVLRDSGTNLEHKWDYEQRMQMAKSFGQFGANGGGGLANELISAAATIGIAKNVAKSTANMTDSFVDETDKNSFKWTCLCGNSGITAKFCGECGRPKPVPKAADMWNCVCGNEGITAKFCGECGRQRPVSKDSDMWNCICGKKGITAKFCEECGRKRPESENY